MPPPVTSVGVGDAAEPEVAQQLAVPLRRPLPVVHRDDHVGLREGDRGKMQRGIARDGGWCRADFSRHFDTSSDIAAMQIGGRPGLVLGGS